MLYNGGRKMLWHLLQTRNTVPTRLSYKRLAEIEWKWKSSLGWRKPCRGRKGEEDHLFQLFWSLNLILKHPYSWSLTVLYANSFNFPPPHFVFSFPISRKVCLHIYFSCLIFHLTALASFPSPYCFLPSHEISFFPSHRRTR